MTLSGEEGFSKDVGHIIGMRSIATNNWKLIDLNITTNAVSGQTENGHGKSNYGIYTSNSSGYEINRCLVTAGAASGGNNGANGNPGGNGTAGTDGGDGGCGSGCSTRGSKGTGGDDCCGDAIALR